MSNIIYVKFETNAQAIEAYEWCKANIDYIVADAFFMVSERVIELDPTLENEFYFGGMAFALEFLDEEKFMFFKLRWGHCISESLLQ